MQAHLDDGRAAVPGRVCCVGRYVFAQGLVGDGADCAAQRRAAIDNLGVMLRAAGSSLDRVLRITYYVRDASELPPETWGAWFVDCWPRSTVVELGSLPDGVLVELEATATVAGCR